MIALRALAATAFSDLRRRPALALASTLAMAAGVAVFVGIQTAGTAARSSFVSTIEAVAGRATHQIISESGIPEERFAEFMNLPGVEAAQPVVEDLVAVVGHESATSDASDSIRELRTPLRLCLLYTSPSPRDPE